MAATSTTGTVAPSAATKETQGPAATGALLAFTAGFVDTCGFIALFGLFTAHVTGNFVLIGAAIADPHQGLIGKLLALPVFILVVAATHLFVLGLQRRSRGAVAPVLVAQIACLALFLLTGVAASPFVSADAPLAIVAGMLGVAAMAIQNAASRTVFASLSPTTVMTGNVTQIVIDLVDLTRSGPAADGTRGRLGKMGAAVAAFAVGALGGGLGYMAAGFWCLAVPILAVAAVLIGQRRAA
jgi:uncharacterized membrane protein YoaK (UPF0700 family)